MNSDDNYSRWRSDKRFRLRVVVILLPALIALALILYKTLTPKAESFIEFQITIIIVAMMVFSVMGILMLYLQTGFRRTSSRETAYQQHDDMFSDIRHRLKRLDDRESNIVAMLDQRLKEVNERLQAGNGLSQVMSDEDRASLVETIRARLVNESADQVLSAMQARVEEQAVRDTRTKMLNRQFTDSIQRLQQEVSALSRRGNLNLVLGILTTVTGLSILGYYVFHVQPSGQDPWLFTTHFLPRLTLVLFIEIFAYFFLRLYKSSLMEIKYFQNEITNLEAKFIALSIALESDNQETSDEVIAELSRTERNHILDKGQTTVELERARADKDVLSDFVAKVLALMGKATD